MLPAIKNIITIQSRLNYIINLILNLFLNITIFQQKIFKRLEIVIISRTIATTTRISIRFNRDSNDKGFDLLKFVKDFIKKVEKVGDRKISKFSELFLVSTISSSDYYRIISLNLIKEDLDNYSREN